MTNKQFRIAQDSIGCTNSKLAEWMAVTPETLSRWRSGKKPIPVYAERILSALATGWRP